MIWIECPECRKSFSVDGEGACRCPNCGSRLNVLALVSTLEIGCKPQGGKSIPDSVREVWRGSPVFWFAEAAHVDDITAARMREEWYAWAREHYFEDETALENILRWLQTQEVVV